MPKGSRYSSIEEQRTRSQKTTISATQPKTFHSNAPAIVTASRVSADDTTQRHVVTVSIARLGYVLPCSLDVWLPERITVSVRM